MGIKWSIHSTISVFLVFGILYITREDQWWLADQRKLPEKTSQCDLFTGKWVFDNKSHPLYTEQQCSYKFNGLTCQRAGRTDLNYLYWRWQPHNCDLPRFDAGALLERLRGKRLVYVGDSLTRNQWASMACLLESLIPQDLKEVNATDNFAYFKVAGIGLSDSDLAMGIGEEEVNLAREMKIARFHIPLNRCLFEYNTSVEHYWEPYLVESNNDDPVMHDGASNQIVRVQAIESHARHWVDADILVFNTYLWWTGPKMNIQWKPLETPERIYKEVDLLRAYERALKTWSEWLEVHVNRTRTKLFFVSLSPAHKRGVEWGMIEGQNCFNETEPIQKLEHKHNRREDKMMRVVESILDESKRRSGLKVQILKILQLSEYRKDAHASIHYWKHWKPFTKEQMANPTSYADCVHWCLPGLPDVWNELLYAYIFPSF